MEEEKKFVVWKLLLGLCYVLNIHSKIKLLFCFVFMFAIRKERNI